MKRPNILLVNDDGIDSPGIRVLAEQASALGDVWVVAPDCQCSAMSQRISIFEPLRIRQVEFPAAVKAAWRVCGTPADCVKAALEHLLPVKPDLLFSGINNGYNTGFDIAYSGTIGAAMEGLMKGVPAYAFSNCWQEGFTLIERELGPLLRELLAEPAGPGSIWNVNFPGGGIEAFRGIRRDVRVAHTQLYLDNYLLEPQPDGTLLMHNRGFAAPSDLAPEGTDVHAVLNGYISVGRVRCAVL
ncbi:MAG: 5'/3'-nucleotidase SurE [Oscillospiraceae bacterium]|nr:5'/3'-nucleotidase SurE [Oscillospiraceae bacterium]